MHWKQRLLLLQERVSPPRPGRNFGDKPTPIRPGPGAKPSKIGRTPIGQFVPIPEIDITIPQSDFFRDMVELIATILQDQPDSAIKTSFFRKFSKFLNPNQMDSPSVSSQLLNDLLRFMRALDFASPDVPANVGNGQNLFRILLQYSDMGEENLLQYLALRYGIGVRYDELGLKINWQVSFDVDQKWNNFIMNNAALDDFLDSFMNLQPRPENHGEILSYIANIQTILSGLPGDSSSMSQAIQAIRESLILSIRQGDILGVLENMIRYQTQLTDMFSDLVELLDNVDMPSDVRDELYRDLTRFYENFTAPQFENDDGPFGVLIRYLMGEDPPTDDLSDYMYPYDPGELG